MYNFDIAGFDALLDDRTALSDQDRRILAEKRGMAFEALQRNDMDLMCERLDFLVVAGRLKKREYVDKLIASNAGAGSSAGGLPANTSASDAPAPSENSAASARASDGPPVDYSVLATREELIKAFGTFTGMKASWFDNLKDKPALKRARKVIGQGGRAHIKEPMFCPFAVMQWLTSEKFRIGKKLSVDKGWDLLEKHFPRAYNVKSVGDPRSGD